MDLDADRHLFKIHKTPSQKHKLHDETTSHPFPQTIPVTIDTSQNRYGNTSALALQPLSPMTSSAAGNPPPKQDDSKEETHFYEIPNNPSHCSVESMIRHPPDLHQIMDTSTTAAASNNTSDTPQNLSGNFSTPTHHHAISDDANTRATTTDTSQNLSGNFSTPTHHHAISDDANSRATTTIDSPQNLSGNFSAPTTLHHDYLTVTSGATNTKPTAAETTDSPQNASGDFYASADESFTSADGSEYHSSLDLHATTGDYSTTTNDSSPSCSSSSFSQETETIDRNRVTFPEKENHCVNDDSNNNVMAKIHQNRDKHSKADVTPGYLDVVDCNIADYDNNYHRGLNTDDFACCSVKSYHSSFPTEVPKALPQKNKIIPQHDANVNNGVSITTPTNEIIPQYDANVNNGVSITTPTNDRKRDRHGNNTATTSNLNEPVYSSIPDVVGDCCSIRTYCSSIHPSGQSTVGFIASPTKRQTSNLDESVYSSIPEVGGCCSIRTDYSAIYHLGDSSLGSIASATVRQANNDNVDDEGYEEDQDAEEEEEQENDKEEKEKETFYVNEDWNTPLTDGKRRKGADKYHRNNHHIYCFPGRTIWIAAFFCVVSCSVCTFVMIGALAEDWNPDDDQLTRIRLPCDDLARYYPVAAWPDTTGDTKKRLEVKGIRKVKDDESNVISCEVPVPLLLELMTRDEYNVVEGQVTLKAMDQGPALSYSKYPLSIQNPGDLFHLTSDPQALVIKEPGDYFVYFSIQLDYKTGVCKRLHDKVISRDKREYGLRNRFVAHLYVKQTSPRFTTTVLGCKHTCRKDYVTEKTSYFVGGIFHLSPGDRLYVQVSNPEVIGRHENNFLGLFRLTERGSRYDDLDDVSPTVLSYSTSSTSRTRQWTEEHALKHKASGFTTITTTATTTTF